MGSTLERGTLLHKRYRIVEILGQGGMGSVYRAVDENLGVDVAVKENLFASDEYARQFRLEAVLLANLRHAHLPRVTDHFVIDNQGQYLIMDYIEGEDLRQRMERLGTISEQEALLIGVGMCDALEYLHTRKPSVIHRDVKPGNVRISPDGHIYLVDFGLAKLVKGSQATTTGARAMTPGYSPPEQYGTARTDPRTDVYSLGATLYAALTGVIPEDGLARAMDNVELTPLRKRNPGVTRKFASAVEKAMAVRPDDRFQSAEEFKQALVSSNVKTQRLEGDLILDPPPQTSEGGEDPKLAREIPPPPEVPAGSLPVSPSQPPRRSRRASTWWAFSTVVVLAALAGGLTFFWTPLSKSLLAFLVTPTAQVSGQSTSTLPGANTPLAPTQDRSTVKLVQTPTGTPIGPQSTRPATLTRTPTEGIFLPSITPTFTATSFIPTLVGGGSSQIAFVSNSTGKPQIYIINSDLTGLKQVTNLPDGACQPNWSPDGARLVFISPCADRQYDYPGAKLNVINPDGSQLTPLPYSDQGDFDPVWSPDGRSIAFTTLRTGSDQIFLMSLPDYKVTQLTDTVTDVRFPDWSREPAWSPDGTKIVYTGHSRLTDAQQIWIMSGNGQDQNILIPRGPTNWDFLPTWSLDGKTIMFTETNGPVKVGWLMLFDLEHPSQEASHLRSGTFANNGSFSPDGRWVIYESVDVYDANNTSYNIYLMENVSGSEPVLIDTGATLSFDPVWRPGKP